MNNKKIIQNTIGLTFGSVAIQQANTIKPFGDVIGSTIGAGLVSDIGQFKKKK